jgi:DNA-directed RNA polymerase subunit omega
MNNEHVFAVDCLRHVPNPFVVVHLAARRARQLRRGDQTRIAVRSTNSARMALQEIAAGAVRVDELFAPLQISNAAKDSAENRMFDEMELLAGMSRDRSASLVAYCWPGDLTACNGAGQCTSSVAQIDCDVSEDAGASQQARSVG